MTDTIEQVGMPLSPVRIIFHSVCRQRALIDLYYQIITIRAFIENPILDLVVFMEPCPDGDEVDWSILANELRDDRVHFYLEGDTLEAPPKDTLVLKMKVGLIAIRKFSVTAPGTLTDDGHICLVVDDGNCDGDGLPPQDALDLSETLGDGLVRLDDFVDGLDARRIGALEERSGQRLHEFRLLLRNSHSNRLFWNNRYEMNPALGSGIGSRGIYKYLKQLLLLRNIPIGEVSVLDFGCGDLEVLRELEIENYTGVDVSEEAIQRASRSRPDWTFVHGSILEAEVDPADVVLCFEVVIHCPSPTEFEALIHRICSKAKKRVIISGYDFPIRLGEMTFFHRSLVDTLAEMPGFTPPTKLASYHDLSVYCMDRLDSGLLPPCPLTTQDMLTSVLVQNDWVADMQRGHTVMAKRIRDLVDGRTSQLQKPIAKLVETQRQLDERISTKMGMELAESRNVVDRLRNELTESHKDMDRLRNELTESHKDLDRLHNELTISGDKVRTLRDELRAANNKLARLTQTVSWKVTQPLRSLRKLTRTKK